MAIHTHDGWFWERGLDGGVRITRRHHDRVIEEHILTAPEWASVVAAVSLRGETGATYGDALTFHTKSQE